MPKTPQISEAEWEVMKIIWDQFPITANSVVEALEPRKDWNPRTVKTMLNRLVKKGALSFQRAGKTYLYRPKVSKEDSVKAESTSFAERVFDGATRPMLLYFAENANLSKKEIQELKRILEKKGE